MLRIVTILMLISVSACSSNWQHAYDRVVPEIDLDSPVNVTVITVDQRPHVIAQADDRNLVGQLKTIGSGRLPIYTTKSSTFGTQIGSAICNGVRRQGSNCVSNETLDVPQLGAILNYGQEHNAQRILIVEVAQWFVEVFAIPKLRYDFSVHVYSSLGDHLSTHSTKGSEILRITEITNPAQNASIAAPAAFGRIISGIMNSSKINQSIRVGRS